MNPTRILILLAAVAWLIPPASARANHGPGTTGGGTAVISGETLARGRGSLTIGVGYTDYENVSRAQAEARAVTAGGFDAIRDAVLTTVSIAYGLTDDLQLGADIGYYDGRNFIDAEFDAGTSSVESGVADPGGVGDLSLVAKYRVVRGDPAHVSLLAGITLPTGADDKRLDNGEVLEASSQPGTGAVSYSGGAAVSAFLDAHTTVNTSVVYTYRDTDDGFQVGSRLSAGVALARRLLHSHGRGAHGHGAHGHDVHEPGRLRMLETFLEASLVSVGHDEIDGVKNPNSGGTTIFLGPGLRVRLSEAFELVVSPAWPVLQHLSGEQAETDFKARGEVSWFF